MSEWLKDNYLVLNISKTKCILFYSHRHSERDRVFAVYFFESRIESVNTINYLGVIFDSHFMWKDQADHVYKKVVARVNVFRRIRKLLTENAAIYVYNGIILPVFDYCDIAWSSLLQQDKDRNQPLQHCAARIRYKNRLILSNVKHNFGKDTFTFSEARVYNILPDYVTKAESIRSFARVARNTYK